MIGANMGYLYYREYYRGLADEDWRRLVTEDKDKPTLSKQAVNHIRIINSEITNAGIPGYSSLREACCIETKNRSSFDLKTTYPGLLVGAGWEHSAGNIDDEFKLGFYFDHTTGLPVIPGSSIKGVLKSAFSSSEYIKGILRGLGIDDLDISKLEVEIFEGEGGNGPIPICKRDIFLDAYIVVSENNDGKFLGEDFITPHKGQYANPDPIIKFLKVLPGVTFRFQFDLKDGVITANQKSYLFKEILLDLGVGAKTNVGYGQFMTTDNASDSAAKKRLIGEEEKRKEVQRQKRLKEMPPADRIFEQYNHDINTIINALKKNEVEFDDSLKTEVAARIKLVMVEKKIWLKPKKPKDKTRVSYIKSILNDQL